jgi:hypothetical protein
MEAVLWILAGLAIGVVIEAAISFAETWRR